MDLNFVQSQPKRLGLTIPEQTLGKGLLQPNAPSNSGSRKQMFNTHNAQKIQLVNSEVPFISTGYENIYGELSSPFVTAGADYKIVAKIPKFTMAKDHIYYLVYFDTCAGKYDVYEVTPYEYITESNGYLKDNNALLTKNPGDVIKKNEVISKTLSYDEYNNRKDGVNLLTCYLAIDDTKEDAVVISESAAKKLSSPIIKRVQITINENDIPRNSYGDNTVYKFMPDLLEYTNSKLLCGIRRQKNEEAFFAQAEDRLSKKQYGDENFIANGQVIDIDIYCNNPSRLGTTSYDDQLKYYYDDHIRLCNDIISLVDSLGGPQVAGYKLQEMYVRAKDCLAGKKYKRDMGAAFSNILLEIVVCEIAPMSKSDKLSNRYGGKGVVSRIVPDHLMPQLNDGRHVEVIQTKNTVVARENMGQEWEMHLNHISGSIVKAMRTGLIGLEQGYQDYRKYIRMVSGTMGECIMKELPATLDNMDEQMVESFVDSLIEDDYLYVAVNPIADNMSIDKLSALYDAFPYAKPEYLINPVESSTGEIEYIEGNRPLVCAPIYYYRLKQRGEEKMSATSMSATNLRDMNVKSKASKQCRYFMRQSPVKIGNQEYFELMHIGTENNSAVLMIYANSPTARRACQAMLRCNPFDINIGLEEDAGNRAAEICITYLKTKGLRITIVQTPKVYADPFRVDPFVIRVE